MGENTHKCHFYREKIIILKMTHELKPVIKLFATKGTLEWVSICVMTYMIVRHILSTRENGIRRIRNTETTVKIVKLTTRRATYQIMQRIFEASVSSSLTSATSSFLLTSSYSSASHFIWGSLWAAFWLKSNFSNYSKTKKRTNELNNSFFPVDTAIMKHYSTRIRKSLST